MIRTMVGFIGYAYFLCTRIFKTSLCAGHFLCEASPHSPDRHSSNLPHYNILLQLSESPLNYKVLRDEFFLSLHGH